MNAKAEFDPYHKWLGIPANEQPPNHYRLLRIDLFELNAEVIENAYDKEMADLKAQEHGQHTEFVEQLSRELIAAHASLLNAEKRAAYDAGLRKKRKTDEDGDELVDELAQRMAIDRAVPQATAELIASRTQLRAQAEQASLREKQALHFLQQLQQQWAVAARATNTLAPSFAHPRFPAQSHLPVQQTRRWVLPVAVAGSVTAVILLIIGVVIGIGVLNARESVTAGTQAGQEQDDNGLKMTFCWCPPGTFNMGSLGPEDNSGLPVTLTSGFWLGKHEVTQDQWAQVMKTEPWSGKADVKAGAEYPATHVNWDDAMEFCQELTDQERRAGRLSENWHYTLPTDAQWEYACRAGSTSAFSFGDDESRLGEFAWSFENAYDVEERYAHQAGVKKPNAWGLHDMHGNVFEWCRDLYDSKLPGGTNPEGTSTGSLRVYRGGSWNYSARDCRSACRFRSSPSYRSFTLGFRLARSSVK